MKSKVVIRDGNFKLHQMNSVYETLNPPIPFELRLFLCSSFNLIPAPLVSLILKSITFNFNDIPNCGRLNGHLSMFLFTGCVFVKVPGAKVSMKRMLPLDNVRANKTCDLGIACSPSEAALEWLKLHFWRGNAASAIQDGHQSKFFDYTNGFNRKTVEEFLSTK